MRSWLFGFGKGGGTILEHQVPPRTEKAHYVQNPAIFFHLHLHRGEPAWLCASPPRASNPEEARVALEPLRPPVRGHSHVHGAFCIPFALYHRTFAASIRCCKIILVRCYLLLMRGIIL